MPLPPCLCCLLLARRLGCALLFEPCTNQRVVKSEVPLVAGVLEDGPDRLLHGQLTSPRPRPGGRILDGEAVHDDLLGHTPEALGHLHSIARVAERVLAVEVGGLDDERIPLPPASRGAYPLPNAPGRHGATVERHDPDVVNHLGQDHDHSGRLHDVWGAVSAWRRLSSTWVKA